MTDEQGELRKLWRMTERAVAKLRRNWLAALDAETTCDDYEAVKTYLEAAQVNSDGITGAVAKGLNLSDQALGGGDISYLEDDDDAGDHLAPPDED